MKKLIASADRQAMTGLLQANLAKRTAAEDKDADFITSQVIDDHKEYSNTLQSILAEDKKEAWDPNDQILD